MSKRMLVATNGGAGEAKVARLASAALREWMVKALAEWGEDPPEPWDWNDIPLVDHIAAELHATGWRRWSDDAHPEWQSPLGFFSGPEAPDTTLPVAGARLKSPSRQQLRPQTHGAGPAAMITTLDLLWGAGCICVARFFYGWAHGSVARVRGRMVGGPLP